ncbi:hypothetical protein [Herbaspirillum sp. CAH-3]|uniref:hypothetical protein n=1 Tax=Herbaspirillum sp. CAH-3 TaxID=2605746 RepID=UPI0012ACC780|nr:hypothetical protein [Herbaspirillum sp. CAH-3]MRT30030.1 hypothetical protein [Herbaspirillum sp. CAH-3]
MNDAEVIELLESQKRADLIEYLRNSHSLDFQRLCCWLTSYRSVEIWNRDWALEKTRSYFSAQQKVFDRALFTGDRNVSFDKEMTWLHDFVLHSQKNTASSINVQGVDFYPIMDVMLWLLVELATSEEGKKTGYCIEVWMQWLTFILQTYHRPGKRIAALWNF